MIQSYICYPIDAETISQLETLSRDISVYHICSLILKGLLPAERQHDLLSCQVGASMIKMYLSDGIPQIISMRLLDEEGASGQFINQIGEAFDHVSLQDPYSLLLRDGDRCQGISWQTDDHHLIYPLSRVVGCAS